MTEIEFVQELTPEEIQWDNILKNYRPMYDNPPPKLYRPPRIHNHHHWEEINDVRDLYNFLLATAITIFVLVVIGVIVLL